MTDDPIEVARDLRTRSPRRLWGLSPESIYTALAAVSAANSLQDQIAPHIRAETLRTNDKRDRDRVVTVHRWVLSELELVHDGEPTLLGALVLTSEDPESLLRSVAATSLRDAETVLRSCGEIDGSLPRREFDSLLADERDEVVLGPLLGSLGFVTVYPDSVELHHQRIERALGAQGEKSIEHAVATAYEKLLWHITAIDDEGCIEDVASRIAGGSSDEESSVNSVVAVLAGVSPRLIDSREIENVVAEQREQYERRFDALRSLLAPTSEYEIDYTDTGDTVDAEAVSSD
ncbi:hypothetical protein FXF75_21080, partial [Halorussus sp. MSC15.2]|nr:hypothetical protein [Halorussus sp. MSC15.2]